MAGQPQAPKKCHNCRRQRLRCDRSYPQCNKCVLSGKECLGYGQLLRWTGAVASRGKLAGKTSSADVSLPSGQKLGGDEDEDSPEDEASEVIDATASRNETKASDMQLVAQDRVSDALYDKPWVLADPVFQDLSQTDRYYISYFTTRLCRDLVSHDLPDNCNPFHKLVPMTRSHPLLHHIIVASSAAHKSNLVRSAQPPFVQSDGKVIYQRGEASQQALQEALVAKLKALRLMHEAVANVGSVPVDIIFAAALFFIYVELLESGKNGWRAHLEGAGRLMSIMQTIDPPLRELRDSLLSDCFCYFVLSSAFTPEVSSLQTYFDSANIPTILEKTTASSYLCCPPEVLEILYAASQLSNVVTEDAETATKIASEGFTLLHRAQNFNVRAWAVEVLKNNYYLEKVLESRVNVATVHRLAASVYIMQAIEPIANSLSEDIVDAVYLEMFYYLERIPPEDPNFKATSWPTFVAGAGAKDPQRRAWIIDRFQKLLVTTPWGFMNTCMETLSIIWGLEESEHQGKNWIQVLKDPKMNFLIV
ncbi:unnamed protein product [Clonostachys rhizophaga]|uniref:Zn(2)-C6 fungal-type domain-containing protein n=1 Tax=Clonostachys rhizophaga TaxID=160324 RepID=A0A9N9VF56_9HYPO|nr:unnamed protein product [Clonostachys rhizophaga]